MSDRKLTLQSSLGVLVAGVASAALVLSMLPAPAFADPGLEEEPVDTEQPVDPTPTPDPIPEEQPVEETEEPDVEDEPPVEALPDEALTEEEVIAELERSMESLSSASAQASAARSATGFRAGNIISDANFYNGSAMSAKQVQTFLNKRVSNPTSSSLRNYKQKTGTIAKNSYCKKYTGKSSERAAQIIAKVGKACGISQKALLVILQKETSLVAMASPEKWRYDRAMGYACPDTGPNGTANCNTSYYGFFNQMYNSAKRLKQYAKDSSFNWFPVGKPVKIYYGPKGRVGCKNPGYETVTIENKATAALYYYTPYTPNKAILSGKPDKCSSWGNYNFYAIYKQWFGTPQDFFSDVTKGDSFYKHIEWMGRTRLSTGSVTADGIRRYLPKSSMTRGQMATFLYRMAGRPKVKLPKKSPFADVKKSHTFYKPIIWMHQQKITSGMKNKSGKLRYGVNNRLTRGQMASFLFRMSGSKYKAPKSSPFADVKRGDKYYRAIAWMHQQKLAKGSVQPKGKPKYGSSNTMRREWMAVFLYRYK